MLKLKCKNLNAKIRIWKFKCNPLLNSVLELTVETKLQHHPTTVPLYHFPVVTLLLQTTVPGISRLFQGQVDWAKGPVDCAKRLGKRTS